MVLSGRRQYFKSMAKIDQIRESLIKNLEGTEVFDLCWDIVNNVLAQHPDQVKMLTYASFARMTKTEVTNPALILAVNYLANPFTVGALEKHYMVFGAADDDVGHLLSDDEVVTALREGILVLPDGREVDDVQAHLVAYFTPNHATGPGDQPAGARVPN